MEETRVCKRCGKELPITEFYSNRYGLTYVCKECYREARSKSSKRTKEIEELRKQLCEARQVAIERFSPRELMQELYRRGYEGELLPPRVPVNIANM